jgi:hypothetical protein
MLAEPHPREDDCAMYMRRCGLRAACAPGSQGMSKEKR